MKKTKEMFAKGFYLLQGEASGNSCFIENFREAKLFIRLAGRYLKDYVKIHEYLLTAEGWMLQISLNSEDEILKKYNQKRRNKNKAEIESIESWRIISEQVRLLLSQYVTKTNKMEGRTGSKVKESYRRYYFETKKEAKSMLSNMRNQKIRMIQRNKKYRKVKTHYQIAKKEGKGNVFLCGKRLRKKKWKKKVNEFEMLKSLLSLKSDQLLVADLVEKTIKAHNPTSPP